ncbi:vacuolar fusion protein MON1 [Kockovaella imperatae]|uniref:Vacuolar fusion protein MON1 n=1 Tax=Kockovaella imperatae TaxID=4999 RepID=A0A1Y1UAI1_9TREE|nr:vacuolar fusion protein MON1 [Kockovaella imperatae]ORX34517.1 vacuolar fusion protein MON1 [Kockovaella imperatae]
MVIGSGSARMGLRDLVKRSSGISRSGETSRARTVSISRRRLSRQYYILTHAGKLVFASGENEQVQSLMGVAQALVSIYAAEDDRPRSIIRGKSRISFLLKAPLYLFCVSDWGEPEHVLRTHLEYIHLQVLSIVTSTQLAKAFQRRSNFDLSRLLEGTEHFLHTLIKRAQHDFSYLTSSLEPLRMAPSLREAAAAALMPPAKFRDLLYVLLIASGRIVTLLRPRKHSIHPSDLHLLLNTLAASPTLTSSETWIPICFPKFNPAGYVHAYISPVTEDITLVFISADREAFNDLQGWKDIVVEKLARDQTLSRISQAIPLHSYSVSAVSLPGLYHFIYKSRQSIQITAPSWEPPYDGAARDRLITLYQHLHDSLHAKAGQAEPLRLVYVKTQHEACLGWMTKPFELYMAVSPHLSKAAVVSAANAVATFMSKEEARVFIKDAPVF